MRSLTWGQVHGRRLARSYLLEPAPRAQLVEVVGAIGGMHAQVMASAELALGARIAGLAQADVREELWERRRLIKTYSVRGTLHLLPTDELSLWMAAMCAHPWWREPQWSESRGLEPAQADAIYEAIGEALDGAYLTREELADEVARRVGSWAREQLASTWGELLRPAAYMGLLCFGPSRGSKVTFVRPDQWAGLGKEHDPGEALLEVVRRYLAAYGPATHQGVARWFSLKPAEASELLRSLAEELEEVDVEGDRAWLLAVDADDVRSSAPDSLRLVPQYDPYVVGCTPRDRLVPARAHERVFSYRRGRFEGASALPVLLVDGVVAGIWERRQRGKQIEIRVEPFQPLSKVQRERLEVEAVRVADFLGAEAALSLGTLE